MSFGLLRKQSRVVLARNVDWMTDLKVFWNSDDFAAAKTIGNVLVGHEIGALRDGVDDFAVLVVLEAIVEAEIAAGCATAVGQQACVGKGLLKLRGRIAVQALAVRPRSQTVEQLIELRTLACSRLSM